MDRCRVFAPASVANLGPGFDVLGVAIDGLGDTVTATRGGHGVTIEQVIGDDSLPTNATENTAGIAALDVLSQLGVLEGMRIALNKAVPGGSGLGSSATSAAAGAFAANVLFDGCLTPIQLLTAATRAEEAVSGAFFADNTAPSLLGGAQLVRSYDPLEVVSLGIIADAHLVLVTPHLRVLTRGARERLPVRLTMAQHVEHTARACGVVSGLLRSDYVTFSRSIRDDLVEPVRAELIPGFEEARDAAFAAGADAFTIAGSGPTVLAVTNRPDHARSIGNAVRNVFLKREVDATVRCTTMTSTGVHLIEDTGGD